ncbi:WD repeat-containing protein 38, partial [Ceratobasidium sp. 392]
MKRTKQSFAHVGRKIRRLAESPEGAIQATQSAADANPGPSYAGPSTRPLHAEQHDMTTEPDIAPPVSLPMVSASTALPNPELGDTNSGPSTQTPMTMLYPPQPEAVRDTNLAPAAVQQADTEQSSERSAWTGLEKLVRTMSISASAFGPLKSAVDGLSTCVEIFEDQATADVGYEQLRIELNNLCKDISIHIGANEPPSMTPTIAILARGIEEETKKVMQRRQRSTIGRYAKATEDANEVQECYRRIQTLLNRISLNANMRTWKTINEEVARNRLNGLPKSTEAKYSSAKSHSLGRNGCTPDTRVDVLKLLRHWAHDGQSQKIYWLNGMAGTGKTTIAYSLCEQLKRDGQLAASFFCSRQLPSCRDVVLILPTIAYQLSLFSHPFRYALSNALELDPELHNQPVSEQLKSLIAAPLIKVQETLPSNMAVVIDALDECEDADGVGRLLFALLAEAPSLPIKVFLASRPNPKILKQMESEQGERVKSELRLHELERSVVLSDVKT